MNNDHDMAAISTVQDRRRQLEAYQAATNTTTTASLSASQAPAPLPSAAPIQNTRESIKENTDGNQPAENSLPALNTKKIIQHYDSLSQKTLERPMEKSLLGAKKSNVISSHRSVNKRVIGRSLASSTSTKDLTLLARSIRADTNRQHSRELGNSLEIGLEADSPLQSTIMRQDSVIRNSDSRLFAKSVLGKKSDVLRESDTDTTQATTITSKPPPLHSFATRSVMNHERPTRSTILSGSGKSQEEMYLAQAQLLQLFMKQKLSLELFQEQDQLIQAQSVYIQRVVKLKEEALVELKAKFNVEQNLVFLEEKLEQLRITLLEILDSLHVFSNQYNAYTETLQREGGRISGIGLSPPDHTHLTRWLAQTRDCQRAIDAALKDIDEGREMVYGIAKTMSILCGMAKEELEELKDCSELILKISQVEAKEVSLSSL
ncbi:hypothetical protein BG004_008407 [Podila humilis]|nr:hypothetical protein BG004_008407 [Podila humilis]